MITITCRHCSTNIEFNPATRAALKKSLQFQCPSCSGFLSTDLLSAGRSSDGKHTHSGVNRNLLILGATTLLVLGGLGFFLASKKSGDTNTTTQNIRNEIFNNSYFTQLIATGVTTRQDLEAISDIRPYGDGFIGISAGRLEWKQANDLAVRTGSTVVAAGSDGEMDAWLAKEFVSSNSSAWVATRGDVGALTTEGVAGLKDANGQREVLLHWRPSGQTKADMDLLPMVSPPIDPPRIDPPPIEPAPIHDDGLVAYYPFSGNAKDASGNHYHAEVHGATLTEDKAGNADSAYLFDGSASFILAPVDISPDVMPNMTMVAWARADNDRPIQQLISHDLSGFCRSIGIDNRGGGIGWSAFCGSSQVLGYEPVKVKKWNFVAAVYEDDREMVTLYANGHKMMKQGAPPNGMKNLTIGTNPVHPEFLKGVIDEVRIYNRALDESEIQQLYKSFTEQSEPAPAVDAWIDTQGRAIQATFLRLESETLVINFKEKETRIPLSRLSEESRALAMKRKAEMNP